MRILAIRGQNLASLADAFAVDFAAEPLAGSGIFAITGPTGAGKSTLLDAVCLALFNEIPRLKSAPSSGRIGGESEDTGLSLRDTRAILRHGAGEGFAEVDFAMPDGARYRARWSVKRARGKATGKLQNHDHSFERLDTGERMGGTRTETLAAIRAVLGLSAEQFGRAVLLAQGDFEAFIRADANDRAVLLERLTGSEIYTALGQRAAEKAKALNDRLAGLRDLIALQKGLDDTQRAQAEADLAAALAAEADAGAALDALKQARQWEEQAARLAAQVEIARQGLASAEQRHADAAPRREALAHTRRAQALAPAWTARNLAAQRRDACAAERAGAAHALARAQADEAQAAAAEAAARTARAETEAQAHALAPLLAKARALDVQLEGTARTVHDRQDEAARGDARLHGAATDSAAAAAALQAAQQAQAAQQDWLTAHPALAELARREQELGPQLAEHAVAARALAAAEAERPLREQAEQAALTHWKDAATALDSKTGDHDRAAQALAQAEADLPAADALVTLTDRHARLTRIDTLLAGANGAEQAVVHADAALARTREALAESAATQTGLTARAETLARSLPTLTMQVEDARRELALLRAAASDTAEALRVTLAEGDPCPVCGSASHRLDLFAGKLGDHLRQRGEALKALEAEQAQQQHEALGIAARLSAQADRAAQLTREQAEQIRHLGSAARQRDAARSDLLTAAAEAALPQDAALLPDALAAARAAVEADIAAQTAAQTAADRARQREQSARAERDRARTAHEAARTALETHSRALIDLDAARTQHRAEADRLAAALDRWLAPAGDWRAQADPAAWLATQAAAWRAHDAEAARLAAALPALQQAAAIASEALRQSTDRARELAEALAEAEQDHAALSGRRAALLGAEPVATVEQRLAAARDAAETALQRTIEARQTAAATLAGAGAAEKSAIVALDKAEQDHAGHAHAFAQALAAAALAEQAVAQAAAIVADTLDTEASALDELRNAVDVARTLVVAREGDLAAHDAGERPALLGPDLAAALAAATAARDDAARCRTEADLALRQDDAVRGQTAALRAELDAEQAAADVWLRLDAVIGDRTGATFRRFAQGLTLDRLLEHANARLAELKPRYTLERAPGGDMLIQVVDNDMGGEARGLHNLSGGERFLASLALALGLAEMSTAGGVKIESLFIDEGFGALDPASLGQAIALLEHLHATGRRVGVISHVEELKERIPVQIAVTPTGRGTSRIAVTGN
ncbi:AAA family ATPase [Novosphingobium sp. KCTC 2891]|uniref:AAA family ATPase n=1 Tax=Novosphingobium sp. KCTC 2891 TaxID=2989730 RepID=UPI00222200FF|nr:AAA family ATPase [Novosphingobium sp. KCTC 2891]MCW1385070.1 AAA family ATPase [Novosphingobium sp. KCTC 2891]